MIKVAVFENESHLIDATFDTTNFYYFDNIFNFEYFPSSQSLNPFERIKDYSIIIIDIDLSQKSELDGYSLLMKINQLAIKPEIIILTGHSKVAENLKIKNLPSYHIIQKPLAIEELYLALKAFV